MANLSVPHVKEYAGRHGYEFRVFQRDNCARPQGWTKIEPILDVLADGFDFVLWLDADTLVARKDVDILAAAQPGAHLHMVWHDFDPRQFPEPPHFNSGVMLIRSSEWARSFFTRVWETNRLPHHWHDQAAILHHLGYDDILGLGPSRPDEPSRERVANMDLAWNSVIGLEAPDPIIHHYAGLDYPVRVASMGMASKILSVDSQSNAHKVLAEIQASSIKEINEIVATVSGRLNRTQEALAETQTLAVKRAEEIAALSDRLNRTHDALTQTQTLAVARAKEIAALSDRLDRTHEALAETQTLAVERAEEIAALLDRRKVA
jgi:lipopolysaccharide biosynthesis glycosyltransferase